MKGEQHPRQRPSDYWRDLPWAQVIGESTLEFRKEFHL